MGANVGWISAHTRARLVLGTLLGLALLATGVVIGWATGFTATPARKVVADGTRGPTVAGPTTPTPPAPSPAQTAPVVLVTAGVLCSGQDLVTAPGPGEPPQVISGTPGVLAHTASAPLLVGGRLRVLASGDRIWGEQLAGIIRTYWSCTRPGETVTGVVADDGIAPATVAVQWSDGLLEGIDAATGNPLWHRMVSPDLNPDTSSPLWPTYPSSGLFLMRTPRRDVVMITRPALMQGFAVTDGRPLWTRDLGGTDCGGPGFSTPFTVAGQPIGMTYVYHDECTDTEREMDAATGHDVRTLSGRQQMGEGWRVVPDACQWPNVGCAVFSWVFGDSGWIGADVRPAFASRITAKYNPPPPYTEDSRGWDVDQATGPDIALAADVAVMRISLRPGIQGWAQDRYAQLWTNKLVDGYLYGDGNRVYEVTETAFAAVDPHSGALSTLVNIDGLTGVAGVVTDGNLGVVVGMGGASVVVRLG